MSAMRGFLNVLHWIVHCRLACAVAAVLFSIPARAGVSTVAVGDGHSLFVKIDGTLLAMGANNSGQLGDGTTT